jgi:hypothetical protein
MKRVADSLDDNSNKRAKLGESPDLFGEGLERCAQDVCKQGTDGTGYISGRVFMAWPPQKKKIRVNIQSTFSLSPETFRFDVELTGPFVSEYFESLTFHGNDIFQIALRGAIVEKTNTSSSPNSLPMKLKYDDGVAINWIKRSRKIAEDGSVLDIWKRELS